MANKKYEFTGKTKEWFGSTLKQIRAVVSFGAIAKGEIGGWIEAEANLDVSGDALVYGNADFLLVGPIGSRRDHGRVMDQQAAPVLHHCCLAPKHCTDRREECRRARGENVVYPRGRSWDRSEEFAESIFMGRANR